MVFFIVQLNSWLGFFKFYIPVFNMFVIDFVTYFTIFNQHCLPTQNPRFPPEPPALFGVVGDCWIEKEGVNESFTTQIKVKIIQIT